ncbi:hypothetical protein GU926_02125 [Nibribacter ruber]|uniref:Uncharacterized protein n=1 Tax=Nibribacter ruber TaxID=2698458 RepID=A0A6P1NZE2_9BACT|nr:hypothetical protein [Nibribacter ruber]QHL86303.1 hypothetical protein GU926_02125 [Nibribacter ruber]
MLKYLPSILLLGLLSAGCAKKNYFQESALVGDVGYEPGAKWDSALVTAGRQYQKNGWHRLWWGKHYRQVWAQPVSLPVFDLDKMHGGLTPAELGGGFQTTSLTLENDEGKKFALRSVDKNPTDVVPPLLRNTFVANILRDQTSAIHPYGAAIVSALAIGVKIPHSHPRFVYVPKGVKGLGENAPEFRDRVFLLEEKFEGEESLTKYFGKAKDLVDSEDFLEKRFSEHGHLPDQKAFAKARLFDVLIGDWDRHQGQWQWAVYESAGKTTYAPVPKDRDQAFFKFKDGIIPWLFSRSWAPLSKMKTFTPKVNSVKGYLQNAHFIDTQCLNEVTLEQWQAQATDLQKQLTDELIEKAAAAQPLAAYQLTGPQIAAKLKSRREQLPQLAKEMYDLYSRHVLIGGTDQEEKFEVERLEDGSTKVQVYQVPEDDQKKPVLMYSRTFHPHETKSITLHGLGGKDDFTLKGNAKKGILVNIYGGVAEDDVKDASAVAGLSKKTRVYDTRIGVEVEKSKETKVKKTRDVSIHAFDREGL